MTVGEMSVNPNLLNGSAIEPGARAFFEVVFERDFLKKTSNAFQDFFSEIMEKRYPGGDFIRVRPWGNHGDRKNDGYLSSERKLFQVYAPNAMTAAEAVSKIDEDYQGALPYWKSHFDCWIFVHNSRIGLSPDITAKLISLNAKKPPEALQWGFEDLRTRVFELNQAAISSLLGHAPTLADMTQIAFKDIEPVLNVVGRSPVTGQPDLRPVPSDKIKINFLSDNVQSLLRAGWTKASVVRNYFQQGYNPNLGDEIAQAFQQKYSDLKREGLDPDAIFSELQVFCGGQRRGSATHEAAVLAVLAYLFEECDIFERTGGAMQP